MARAGKMAPGKARASAELSEWRTGWRSVVFGSLSYGSGVMLFQQTGGLFLQPIKQATGWSTTAVTIMPIVTLLYGLFSTVAAWLVMRRGPRFAAMLGLALVGVGVAVLSALPLTMARYYGLAALIGVFGA